MKSDVRPLRQVFRWPAVLAAISLAGLLAALIGDGAWDGVSCLALAAPVAIGLWGLLRASGRR